MQFLALITFYQQVIKFRNVPRRPEKRFRPDSGPFQFERAGFDYELPAPEREDFPAYPHTDWTVVEQSGNATIWFVGRLEDSSPFGECHYFLKIHAVRSTFRRSWQ